MIKIKSRHEKAHLGAGLEASAEQYGMLSAQAQDVPTVKINGCTAAEAIQSLNAWPCAAKGCMVHLHGLQRHWVSSQSHAGLVGLLSWSGFCYHIQRDWSADSRKSQTGKENVYFYYILAKQENWVKSAIWNDWQ